MIIASLFEHTELFESILFVLRSIIEVLLLSCVIYPILLFLRGTRGAPVLAGVVIASLILSGLATVFELKVVSWLLSQMWALFALVMLIIFQPEVRRALAEIGIRNRFLSHSKQKEIAIVQTLVETAFFLAEKKIGALIAIERDIGLRTYAESGTILNADLSDALLSTFFFPNTPLHDGGVILQDDKVYAAGCFFPLTQSTTLSKSLGTRHRAAVGITEETDALCIVCSEESGAVGLAYRGRLTRGIDRDRLKRHLTNFIINKKNATLLDNLEKIKTAMNEENK